MVSQQCSGEEPDNHPLIKLRFAVEDTGVGIKEEDFDKLFKMFGKLEQEQGNMNAQGIGLGLTICNKILNQLGSELQFQSIYGMGTKFFFDISLPFEIIQKRKNQDRIFTSSGENLFAVDHGLNDSADIIEQLEEEEVCLSHRIDHYNLRNKNRRYTNSFYNSDIEEEEKIVVEPIVQQEEDLFKSDESSDNAKILIVDDNTFNIYTIQTMLKHHHKMSS